LNLFRIQKPFQPRVPRLYPNKLPVTAVHLMNNEVISTFEAHAAKIDTVLSDNGREFCGRPDVSAPAQGARPLSPRDPELNRSEVEMDHAPRFHRPASASQEPAKC
jgi:hypothetical protein